MAEIDQYAFFQLFRIDQPLGWIIGSMVSPRELSMIAALIRAFRCSRIAEFGVGRGANAKYLLGRCNSIQFYLGIDVPPGHRTTLRQQRREVPKNAGHMVSDPRFRLMVLPNGTRDIDAGALETLDFIFIDADHKR